MCRHIRLRIDRDWVQDIAPLRVAPSCCSATPPRNGDYFAAATADQLKKVYENIGSDIGYEKADREVTSRFAGYGLALAVLAALGAISLGAKWP
jgi:hypothetical protein